MSDTSCESKVRFRHRGYDAGHPWYYYRGGPVLKPSQISSAVKSAGYKGYLQEDIEKAAKQAEPKRSATLQELKERVTQSLRRNLSSYRSLVRELRKYRLANPEPTDVICDTVHQSICLKHNHIYNDFAHLFLLAEHRSKQLELFGL